jgi:hypothetical protein
MGWRTPSADAIVDRQPRRRGLGGGFGVVEVLAAQRAAGRALRQNLQSGVSCGGVASFGRGGRDIGPGLVDLFGAGAAMQLVDHLLLRRDLSRRLGGLRREPAGVESGQHLSARDPVAFVGQHRGYPFRSVERQLDLSQIDIAVEHQFRRGPVGMTQPRHPGDRHDGAEQGGDQRPAPERTVSWYRGVSHVIFFACRATARLGLRPWR